jgi:hypothetical protein
MTTEWESIVRDLTWSFDDQVPRFRHERWRRCFDDQLAGSPLSLVTANPMFSLPLGEGSVKFETSLSKTEVWKRYRTLSQVAILEGEDLNVGDPQLSKKTPRLTLAQSVEKRVFAALNKEDVQDVRGRVVVHGQTFYAWTSRIPGLPLD